MSTSRSYGAWMVTSMVAINIALLTELEDTRSTDSGLRTPDSRLILYEACGNHRRRIGRAGGGAEAGGAGLARGGVRARRDVRRQDECVARRRLHVRHRAVAHHDAVGLCRAV